MTEIRIEVHGIYWHGLCMHEILADLEEKHVLYGTAVVEKFLTQRQKEGSHDSSFWVAFSPALR